MKRIRILLAALLTLALVSSAFFLSTAEPAAAFPWQADITKLMNPADVPHTTQIDTKNSYAEGVKPGSHEIACEVTVNGVTYGCEFVFDVIGEGIEDWAEVQSWLGALVTEAARTHGGDSESLANEIDRAIAAARRGAASNADGSLPGWASKNIAVRMLRVSTPFYPELSVGKNGELTKRLQRRLIELGFLDGAADGYFGEQTKAAVEAAERYVRELEQALIDARPKTTPAPTAQAVSIVNVVAATATPESTHELTLVPKFTPEATAEMTPEPTTAPMPFDEPRLEPVTQVDGVADALLQAYLYSQDFALAQGALKLDTRGIDIERLQRRMLNLGCAYEQPDGIYGENLARAVRIFQYFNGLKQTGVADMNTLSVAFSAEAKAPPYPMLVQGAAGDEVRAMQTRLRELGFTNVVPDGDYGDGTKAAVEQLQQYLRDMEREALLAKDASLPADADISGRLSLEVNGIADPMLLEAFYSTAFPDVPAAQQNGSKGRDVLRIQRRLAGLDFFHESIDGHYGDQTQLAVKAFQKRNKLSQSGVADGDTLARLFSDKALKALKPYVIKVSTDDQRVYVYGLDDNSEYTVLEKEMKCSTGKKDTPTPKGTFQSGTGPGARWHYFKKFDCWAQYAYYIEGDILFHSVLYNEKDGPVTRSSVNNLGRKASHGCVRLSVEDAKWIYTNCPRRTKVIVY